MPVPPLRRTGRPCFQNAGRSPLLSGPPFSLPSRCRCCHRRARGKSEQPRKESSRGSALCVPGSTACDKSTVVLFLCQGQNGSCREFPSQLSANYVVFV